MIRLVCVVASVMPLAAQSHTRTPFIHGQVAELVVNGASPGDTAFFVFGFGGRGAGLCVPPSGPCLGVLAPLLIAPAVTVGASGVGGLSFVINPTTALVPVATQALVLSPSFALHATNSIEASVEPIAALSDEFVGSSLDPAWQILNPQTFSFQVASGGLVMNVLQGGPSVSWYADGEGPFVYRDVTGDFDVSADVHCYSASNPNASPSLSFNLGGLCVRDPIAPPGDHDWVHLTVGGGTSATRLAVEDKSTIDSSSDLLLYPVPDTHIEMRITRRGALVSCFWREVGAPSWIALRAFDRPDLPPTVQVGLDLGFWPANVTPDLEMRVDWIRFAP